MIEKRYYWLKLKEDFFKQKELKKLRNVAGGDTYTIIYLKMQLLSLKTEGRLIFDEIEDTFAEELSLELDETVDNIKMTLAFLRRSRLIEEITEDELLLPTVINCTGSETTAAERMRRVREKKKCNNIEQECNIVTLGSNLVTQSKREEKELEKRAYIPPRAQDEKTHLLENQKLKKLSEGSLQIWQMLSIEQEVKFTNDEWNAIKGYAMAKPSLKPHQITASIIQLNKWAQDGLDIENALLSGAQSDTRYAALKQPFMCKITDAKGNPIYGKAIVERRNRIIEAEELRNIA